MLAGGAAVLLPNVPLVKLILWSQILNGAVLPLVLAYMTVLVNKKRLMKEWSNSPLYNVTAWGAVIIMSGLTVALVGISLQSLFSQR